jgi:hypothetical protein
VIATLLASGLLCAAAMAEATAPDTELRLSAERLVVDEGRVSGEGTVRALLLGGELRAERFEASLDGRGLVVEQGCWERPDGELCFERLELGPEGELHLERAKLTLCSCQAERQPWSVQALRVRVDPEGHAVFVGGLLRVGGCPVLPLPAGTVPIGERRSGLLAPVVGWTPDGLELGQPVYLDLGPSADLELTPTWRRQRGLRLDSELRWALPRGSGLHLRAAGGHDALEQATRGVVEARGAWVDRDLRSAIDGSLASDLDYRRDYELDFTSRQQGFHELRALVGLGPFRLDHDSFQASELAPQRLLGLSYRRPSRDAGALSPAAGLSLELGGQGVSAAALDTSWLAARGDLGLAAGRPLGPLEGEALLLAEGLLVQPVAGDLVAAGPASLQGRLSAEAVATLPLWADHGELRHLLRPALVVGGAVVSEDPGMESLQPRLGALPAYWAGPRLESRWLSPHGVPLHLRADLPWSDLGLAPGLQAWWGRGPWWGRLQGSAAWLPGAPMDGGLAWLEAGHSTEGLRISAGALGLQEAAHAGQLSARVAWRLPLGADRWEPRARVRWAPTDAVFVERHLGLYFASRCDCLGLELGVTWAEDRGMPDLGMRVDLGR